MTDPRSGSPGGRSVVITPRAMAAASQPLAVSAALELLRTGGTAVDAAIAANAVLSLVEPMSCGPGGDLFAIIWDAASKRLHGLNGSGRAPARLTLDRFARDGLERIPEQGPLSWTVPGCVDAWFALHERFGRRPIPEILAPAISLAERGFPVSPIISAAWAQCEDRLRRDPGGRETFLVDGRAPRTGEIVRNPDLARTLRRIADGGSEAFYRGEIADRIDQFSRTVGGALCADDLAAHTSTWVDPISAPYRGYDVWELPPNTQGLAVLQILAILEGFDLRGMGPGDPEYLHRYIEAKKLVYADRAAYYGDPEAGGIPVDALLSPAYAAARRRRIAPERAALEAVPGLFGDTVYLTVVDEQRNCASWIQSIYADFGSGLTPPGLGFALQNRGCLFHLDPDHPNSLAPGKRPFHTIIPGFVTLEGRPVFPFGVMGGDMQPQGQVQVLVCRIDFGMDPQAAGEALRVRHIGSQTPTGDRMSDGGTVVLEPGFPEETADVLRAKGHRVVVRAGGFGGYQGIWIDPETDVLHGGSDPRKDGCAMGY